MSLSHLSSSVRVGAHTLANRLVMNPMTRSRANAEGLANEMMATYYAQRASAGLIVTEGIAPSANGKGYARIPGLWSADQVQSWKPVTRAVHDAGGVIFAQLMHTGRVSHPANMTSGARVVAPSALPLEGKIHTDALGMQDYPVPEALDEAGLEAAKEEFVRAAKNAVAAGFDGVELHGANGYLLEKFLSPHTNQRTDRFGGSVQNRLRFVVDTVRAVAAAIGQGKVGLRISPHGTNGGMPAYPEIDETYLALADALAPLGIAYLHVADHGYGKNAALASLEAALRKAWPGVLLIGGSWNAERAAAAIAEGRCDLVGFGKAFLANPDLPARIAKGLPLNPPDPSTFFTPGSKGYTDYPSAS